MANYYNNSTPAYPGQGQSGYTGQAHGISDNVHLNAAITARHPPAPPVPSSTSNHQQLHEHSMAPSAQYSPSPAMKPTTETQLQTTVQLTREFSDLRRLHQAQAQARLTATIKQTTSVNVSVDAQDEDVELPWDALLSTHGMSMMVRTASDQSLTGQGWHDGEFGVAAADEALDFWDSNKLPAGFIPFGDNLADLSKPLATAFPTGPRGTSDSPTLQAFDQGTDASLFPSMSPSLVVPPPFSIYNMYYPPTAGEVPPHVDPTHLHTPTNANDTDSSLSPPPAPSPSPELQPEPLVAAKRPSLLAPSASRPIRNMPVRTRRIPLDAPVQLRNYVYPSVTAKKDIPKAFEPRAKRLRAVSAALNPEEPAAKRAKEQEALLDASVENKRRQNTLAARRSREKKANRIASLETQVDEQAAKIAVLERALGKTYEEVMAAAAEEEEEEEEDL